MSGLILLGSITDVRAEHAGCIAVSGSHGGLFPAAVASAGKLRAVVFNDAGIGLENAGVAGVHALADIGFAAAAADCMTCRIGSAKDTMATGRISVVNAVARDLGVTVGQRVADAAEALSLAKQPAKQLAVPLESRRTEYRADGRPVQLLDSASMVGPSDTGEIVVTGSHGALIGGNPERALKARARLAAFNDAGGGKDAIGVSRLAALEAQNIAAVTVSHLSARIGDAMSSFQTGRISAFNAPAAQMGAAHDLLLRDLLNTA